MLRISLHERPIRPNYANIHIFLLLHASPYSSTTKNPLASEYQRKLGNVARTKASRSEGIDMQHHYFPEHMSFQPIDYVDCSSATMTDNLQSYLPIFGAYIRGQHLTCTFSALMC